MFGTKKQELPTTMEGIKTLFGTLTDSVVQAQEAIISEQDKIKSEACDKINAAKVELDAAKMFQANLDAMVSCKVVTEAPLELSK